MMETAWTPSYPRFGGLRRRAAQLKRDLSFSIIDAYIPTDIHERSRQHACETSCPGAPSGAPRPLGDTGGTYPVARRFDICRRSVGVVTRCCNLRGHWPCRRVSQHARAERFDRLPPEITVTGFFF